MTLFSSVQLAPKDPIFGLTEAYVADQRPDKVNLVVDRIDQEGRRTPGVLRVDLPGDIGPGETREVRLRVIEGSRRALGWFEIDLCLEWLGRFGGAGRCRPAQIMAEALEGPVG